VIDLHLHTTASDGRSSPEDLVREAKHAGIQTLSVTDHDTTAAFAVVARAAAAAGLVLVPGVEMTAIADGRDIHILGYFFDPEDPDLNAFLAAQREVRRLRFHQMADRLAAIGAPVDVEAVLAGAGATGRALGRPLLAAAIVAAGRAQDIADAFDRFLAEGRPAYVNRPGSTPADVIERIHRAGGLASLAHPGKQRLDALVPGLVSDGLDAIEIFHPDHGDAERTRYAAMAEQFELSVTGGSDYHGQGSGRSAALGRVSLPEALFAAFARRAGFRTASS
jgi:hypothetical protein